MAISSSPDTQSPIGHRRAQIIPLATLLIFVGLVAFRSGQSYEHTQGFMAHVRSKDEMVVRSVNTQGTKVPAKNAGKMTGFQSIFSHATQLANSDPVKEKGNLTVNSWTQKGTGGLNDEDRAVLIAVYGAADSLFEWGLGESSLIADHLGVPRYAGIDSDPNYVAMTREKMKHSQYRFYTADIGPIKVWGYPLRALVKNPLDYEIAPLAAEQEAFDVYMVDGRFRFPCLLAAFLHASDRGAPHNKTTVLVHDCSRREYHLADHLLSFQRADKSILCVYHRKANTTDDQLVSLWKENFMKVG